MFSFLPYKLFGIYQILSNKIHADLQFRNFINKKLGYFIKTLFWYNIWIGITISKLNSNGFFNAFSKN